jgi:tetratricopeptide (TPR) repeat protein
MRIAQTLRSVLAVVTANLLAATTPAQQVGGEVVVVRDKATLWRHVDRVASIPQGSILDVEKVHTTQFSIIWSSRARTVRGRINRWDVIAFPQALDFFDEKVKRNPSARGYAIRGSIRDASGDFQRAIADYSDAIELNQKEACAYARGGVAWFVMTQCHKATVRASAWLAWKISERATSSFDAAIWSANPFAEPNHSREWWSKRNYGQAIDACDEAVRLDPNYATSYCRRAYVRLAGWDLAGALADCNEAIQLEPRLAVAYCARAAVYRAMRRRAAAFDDSNVAIRLDPKLPDAYYGRAVVWWAQDEGDKALADCNEAIALNSRNPVFYYARGRIWLWMRANANARADFNKAIRLDPKLPVELQPWRDLASEGLKRLGITLGPSGAIDSQQ